MILNESHIHMKLPQLTLLFTLLFLVLFSSSSAQVPISSHFFGMNAWLLDSVNANRYYGKIDQYWGEIGESSPKIVRIGGIAADHYFFTDTQLLRLIDSIRSIGAEPLVQLPLWAGAYSAANAAAIVSRVNGQYGRNVRYWSIGNEPSLVYNESTYGFSANNYSASDYAQDVRAFSTAIRNIDPSLIIIAADLAWYRPSWVNALLTPNGADDISGQDGQGRDYIDIFSLHQYALDGTQTTQTQVRNAVNALEVNVADLRSKCDIVNATHSRNQPLGFALTETNVTLYNPIPDGSRGKGTRSMVGGQWWAECLGVGMKYGAEFIIPWSVAEGNDGQSNDRGYLSYDTGLKKPTYYHYQLIASYMEGEYLSVGSNVSEVTSFGSYDAEKGFVLALFNYDTLNAYDFTLRLDSGSIAQTASLHLLLDKEIPREVHDTLPAYSTLLLFLSPNGHYIGKMVYTIQEADNDQSPYYVPYIAPRAKKALAHYLPWYNTDHPDGPTRAGWCYAHNCATDTTVQHYTYTPLIGEYSLLEEEVLQYHIGLAAAAHMDGFIININPVSDFQWRIAHKLAQAVLDWQAASNSTDFKLMISYDNNSADSLNILTYLTMVRDSFIQNPAYASLLFRDDATDKPMLMFWSEADLRLYQKTVHQLFGYDEVFTLIRNAREFDKGDASFEWIGYTTNDTLNTTNVGTQYFVDFDWIMARQESFGLEDIRDANTVMMGATYPGFDDRRAPAFWNSGNNRYIARQVTDGETMALTWDYQIGHTPLRYGGEIPVDNPWMQLCTWNDFPEGSNIEPSVLAEEGYKALETCREKIIEWKGLSVNAEDTLGLYLPFAIYQAHISGNETISDSAFSAFALGQYATADTILQPPNCGRDVFEPNDNLADASPLPMIGAQLDAGICPANDRDWYQFSVLAAAPHIRLRLSNPQFDLDLKVYDANGNLIGQSADSSMFVEVLTLNGLSAGTYYVEVLSMLDHWNEGNYALFLQRRNVPFGAIRMGDIGRDTSPSQLQVFVNPDESLSLFLPETEVQNVQVALFSTQGQRVYQTNIDWHGMNAPLAIPLPSLTTGMYSCRITTETGVFIRRLFLRH